MAHTQVKLLAAAAACLIFLQSAVAAEQLFGPKRPSAGHDILGQLLVDDSKPGSRRLAQVSVDAPGGTSVDVPADSPASDYSVVTPGAIVDVGRRLLCGAMRHLTQAPITVDAPGTSVIVAMAPGPTAASGPVTSLSVTAPGGTQVQIGRRLLAAARRLLDVSVVALFTDIQVETPTDVSVDALGSGGESSPAPISVDVDVDVDAEAPAPLDGSVQVTAPATNVEVAGRRLRAAGRRLKDVSVTGPFANVQVLTPPGESVDVASSPAPPGDVSVDVAVDAPVAAPSDAPVTVTAPLTNVDVAGR